MIVHKKSLWPTNQTRIFFGVFIHEVLLLDEPTSALDPKSSALVSKALEQVPSWMETMQLLLMGILNQKKW